MDVILDSNIFRRDLKLKDKNFDILLDYLDKTHSKVLLPQIVIEEVEGLFKRVLEERVTKLRKSHENLVGTLVKTEVPDLQPISIDEELEAYREFLAGRLKTDLNATISYKNDFLPELVERAINRKKPLGGKGQQFRDGLLWLSILDYVQTVDDKRIIFVSNNSTDFSEKGTNQLNKTLQKEAENAGIEVHYYKDLSDFVKEHATQIDFINSEWIAKNIKKEHLESIFNSAISANEDYVRDHYDDSLESNERMTGHINATDYINSSVLNFNVYEMLDGTLLLSLEVEFEKEYEIEIEVEKERDLPACEYEHRVNPKTGELEMEPVFVPRLEYDIEYDYKYFYPLFRGCFTVTIKNRKIEQYEFKDWDWG